MKEALAKIWSLFSPSEKRHAVAMLILVVLMALAETVGVLSIMPFLSVLARPDAVQNHAWLLALQDLLGASTQGAFIVRLGLATVAVVVLSSAFKTIALHMVNRFVHMQRHGMSLRLISQYLHQPYEFFLLRNPSDLSKNVLSVVDQLSFDLLQPLSMLIANGAVVLAMLTLVFLWDPVMALCIMLVVGALYGGVYVLVRRRLGYVGSAWQRANSGRHQACNEALAGIKEVKVTHAAETYECIFSNHSREFSRHSATAETLSTSPLYLVEATGYSGLIAIALLLLWRSGDVAHVLPVLGLYGFAAYRLLPAVQTMYRGFARLRFTSSALDNICQDLSLPRDVGRAPVDCVLVPKHEIRLEGIVYAYPSSQAKPVLDGFDLVIPANTSLGIAGKSGAGKSTVMDILLGLLQPQAGAMTIDGVPITRDRIASWQRAIGYVPQHIYLADATVAENIAFGIPRDQIDMEAVQCSAKAAQIHGFIVDDLPQSYETMVGDRGIRLSGGQRQRIGIARALYRDPPILLMDEATSALDSATEEAVNEAIHGLAGRKTIIVIAHRETSLRTCDRVVSMSANPSKSPNVAEREP